MMDLVRARRGCLVLVAVAAAGLMSWWAGNVLGPQWLKILVVASAFVGATVAAVLAQSYGDWLRERARARQQAAEMSEQRPPETLAGLLRADRQIVPFSGRDAERAELRKWCGDGQPLVRLVVGAGGVGKTRLALDLGEYLKKVGWSVTVVGAGQETGALPTIRAATRRSILLIVDYAETRTGLDDLLRSAARHADHVRVLLIARSAGDWWWQLGSDVPAVRDLVRRAYPPLTLSAQVGSATELVEAAVPHFAAALEVRSPTKIEVTVSDEVPLLVLHAAALLAVLRSQDRDAPGGQLVADLGVLDELLGHERRYWLQSAAQTKLGLGPDVLRRAVAVVCLFGAVDERDGAKVLRRVPDLRDDEPRRRAVVRWLQQLYPPSSGYWGPLQPELVAETHVIKEADRCPELVTADLSELSPEQLRQMLTVLSLGAVHQPAGAELLEKVLRGDITRLVPRGLEVARATGSTLGVALAQVLSDAPLMPTSLREIQAAIPYPTTALAETAVVVTRRILDELPSSADLAETAFWHVRLGVVLAQVGRADEALDHLDTAVEHYRTLVEADRDSHLPGLARALHNVGIRHAEQDRYVKALDHTQHAVEYFRALAETNSDGYRPDLAAILHNRGVWLAELGRHAEAFPIFQEAVDCYAALVESDPDRYLRDRAQARTSQELSLSEAPQATLDQLTNTVDLYRGRAEDNPDSHLPDLARSLYNLGSGYAGQDRLEEAEDCLTEALTHYRSLATGLDRYLPDLAACLNNLGVTVAHRGHHHEAVPFAQEAVSLNQHFAETSPVRYRSELARSLDNVAFCQSKLGQHDEARRHAEQAVELYRDLAEIAPDRYRPELARALDNLGVSLSELRLHAEALPTAQEAVTIYRQLVKAHSHRYWSHLAHALRNLAVDHSELSQHADADRCRQEADQIGEDLRQRLVTVDARGPVEATS